MKRVIAAVLLALSTLVAVPAAATATTCDTPWGSLPKQAGLNGQGPLTDIRGGQHDCYDRLVIDLVGQNDHGYAASYVDEIQSIGSGEVIPTRGAAKLLVSAFGPAYTDDGQLTYHPANWRELVDVTGYRTFRQVVFAGSFEGSSDIGIGLRARLPFRIFTLPRDGGGTRIVVDVAHTW
ncbi:AMIN-like domain-containing (lipo)protein [Actinokineospora inagensis]|uniref:AMIN-like domain-containing (lipo)protein n=1 Tax=Actinokineospora inagensis TaxID=103730 RepID=UPI000407B376|nr:hypothetical protein [Actinokineospora inagensis]